MPAMASGRISATILRFADVGRATSSGRAKIARNADVSPAPRQERRSPKATVSPMRALSRVGERRCWLRMAWDAEASGIYSDRSALIPFPCGRCQ